MSKMLVIVDMQTQFRTAYKESTIKNVMHLTRLAMSQNWPIVVLEYVGYGSTHKCILDLLKPYKNVYFHRKSVDDGSRAVRMRMRKSKLNVSDIIVCGVNISACVRETVGGLCMSHDSAPSLSIRVVRSACNGDEPLKNWQTFRGHFDGTKQVKVTNMQGVQKLLVH